MALHLMFLNDPLSMVRKTVDINYIILQL